ncbi:D-alanine--poly(phosphoribitol) ligase subunit DltC [Bombilactobacillus thymidiniphilus]|uniref:D-alanyl carrier protein n=1 Tax=Bombilactobacillus thymidiniphilus TaxID=2923363 RepID=A0ABY4PE31_9LACO|nr:D-alanine--poly(phosphoribitol) ligase subunit DltC [Bombilactobacillus thymidiniphilus]UQS83890.1 D-alanine--poly(phosphoribitol) ligase subunit DltC [Bombilactobacillus thymidiniphilus]
MDTKETVLNILADLTGDTTIQNNLDESLFDSGLLDSMATVQLLLELQQQLDIDVPVSELERTEWDTPNKIITQVDHLRNA